MRNLSRLSLALLALAASTALCAKEKTRDETILLDKHRVTIAVPEGYHYTSGRDEEGVLMAKLTDAKEKVDLQIRFQLDSGNRLATEAQQMEFLATICRQYAESSVEKGYTFKSLEPRRGSGTYCAFTDASLIGKLPVPKGEFLTVTTGVKVSSGWALVFTVLTNDIASKEYQAALKLMKDSFEETPATPAKT